MKVHDLFAYLCVRDAAAALDFYRRAFDEAELLGRIRRRADQPGSPANSAV